MIILHICYARKKLSFRQFYELIKANKQYIYNKNIPHATCLYYNPDQMCAECHGIYAKDQGWLEWNLRDQWFHEECFSL